MPPNLLGSSKHFSNSPRNVLQKKMIKIHIIKLKQVCELFFG